MIEKVIEIASEAGEIVRSAFGTDFNIEYKTNASNLVTEIDKKSEELITGFVKKNFPGHGILAEEGGGMNTGAEYLWVIDPLDGTTNFAHRLPICGVSIGVQRNGETICGAVNHVMQNTMYSAEKGSGAFRNGKKITVTDNSSIEKSLLVTGFPYDIAENPYNSLPIFVDMVKAARGMRRLGSASIDFCYLAEGIFDGFWEVNLAPWDIAAGMLIVEEAQGITTDFKGKKASIYSKQILCSNSKIHDDMLSIIQRHFQN